MATAKSQRKSSVRTAGFMLRQLTELAAAMRANRGPIRVQEALPPGQPGDIDFIQVERRLLLELFTRRDSGESFAALAADLNRRGVRGRYGARWYTASVRAFLHRRSVDRPVS